MKMINNYLDTLEGYLPEESQEEIRQEFESSLMEQIEDKQQQLGRELNPDEQEKLLLKIGHPLRVASAYLPNQELINKDYFPAYKHALEISLSIFAILTLLWVLPYRLGSMGVMEFLFATFVSVIDVSLTVFLYVTGIFYLFQRYNLPLEILYHWSPKKLSSSGKKVSLSRFEVFFEMAFEALFLVLWNQIFLSEYVSIENNFIENFSMSSDWSIVFLPVNIVVVASFILNAIKLTSAHWNRWLLTSNLALNLISVVLLAYIMQFDNFFTLSSEQLGGHDWGKISYYAALNVRIVIGFIIAVILWDSYSHLKKLRMPT